MIEQVYAQGISPTVTSPLPAGFTNLGSVFGFVLNVVLGLGWALVFVMLALGFVQYVMSKGEKTAVDNAQKWLTYAVIGGVGLFFVTFFKSAIMRMIGATGIGGGTEFDYGGAGGGTTN